MSRSKITSAFQQTVSALWPVALTLMVLFGLPAVVKSYKRLNRRQG